jgi:hypothetical protein
VSSPSVQSLLDYPPPAGYSNSLTGIPDIDDSDIYQYFLVKCDGTDSTAVKHRDKGWNFYKSGKVRYAEFKMDIDDTTLLIRGDVEASFDRAVVTGKVKKKYPVHIVCNKHCGTICGARCVCKAGLGGFCKHVAAVLFFVMDHQRRGESVISGSVACTSALQTWHQPKIQGQACIKFSNLNFESFNYERDNERMAKRRKVNFNDYNSCPDGENCLSNGKIEKFATELSSLGVAKHFVDILQANKFRAVHDTKKGKSVDNAEVVTETSSSPRDVCMPVQTTDDTSRDTLIHELSTENLKFYEEKVKITTLEQQKLISHNTAGQAGNPKWFAERKLRLTASRFKEVACRKRFPCEKFIQRLTSGHRFSNKHTEWGKQAEPIALAEYKTIREQQGFVVFGRDLGLVVNPSFPYLAASPDWFTELKKGNQVECGLVEVKSLSKHANLKPCEAAEFCDFFSYENGKLQIDTSHSYYYQIQGQMAVCGVDWCDLVVWTPKGITSSDVQRIQRDTVFWSNILPTLTNFYFRYLLPEVTKKNS